MGIAHFISFAVGTMANPITAIGIFLIGVLSNKKKTAFGLGLLWGLGLMYLDLSASQQLQSKIPYEVYFVPFSYGFLTLIITWVKSDFFRHGGAKVERVFPPISESIEVAEKDSLGLDPLDSSSPDEPSEIKDIQSLSTNESVEKYPYKNSFGLRRKVIFAIVFSWVLLVAGYVFLAEPYGAYLSDSEWRNLSKWLIVPPGIFVIIFLVFGWATKQPD